MTLYATLDMAGTDKKIAGITEALRRADGYSRSIVNTKGYAAAVERGTTREVFWKDMSKGQRYAIIQAAKAKGKNTSYKREGTTVERKDGPPKSFKIHIPGAFMVQDSKPEIAGFMHGQSLSTDFTETDAITRMVDETALYGLIPITEKTPVDNGGSGLAGAWTVV